MDEQQVIEFARELCAAPEFAELVARRRRDIFERWQVAPTPAEREALHADVRALNELTEGIHAISKRGK